MQKNNTLLYFLLCVLVCILPVSCDVQKRLYRPGFFIQKGSSLPVRSYVPEKYTLRNLPENTVSNSPLSAFNSQSSPLFNYIPGKVGIKNKQAYNSRILSEVRHNKTIIPLEKVNNNLEKVKREESNTPTVVKEKTDNVPVPLENKDYENLIFAFLAGAGSVLLFFGIRSGIRKYKAYNFNVNEAKKTKEKIAGMADKLDRCADRFANANNERVELAARKVATAISKCNDIARAKELEKAFNKKYLSPAQASDVKHIKQNNLLSNDAGYGGGPGTLKPDVVTTTGGYYANSAGSLSWTMGEPISETVSDGSNTLTQGFQQGAYWALTVVDEVAKPTIKISAYPNPVTSLLNIKSDSGDTFRADVIDLQGNIVHQQSFENGQGQIDLSNLSDAMYLLGIYDKDGNRIKVFKIQKVD